MAIRASFVELLTRISLPAPKIAIRSKAVMEMISAQTSYGSV